MNLTNKTIRLVFHLDVTDSDFDTVLHAVTSFKCDSVGRNVQLPATK